MTVQPNAIRLFRAGSIVLAAIIVITLSFRPAAIEWFSRLTVNSGQESLFEEDRLPGPRMDSGSLERMTERYAWNLQVGRVISTSAGALLESGGHIEIYAVGDLVTPSLLGRIRRHGKLLQLVGALGNSVYLTESTPPNRSVPLGRYRVTRDWLLVYDIGVPSSPTLVAELALTAGTTDLYLEGQHVVYCYSTTTGGGLGVIDVSQPSTPTAIGTLSLRIPAQIAASSSLAYVADMNTENEPVLLTVDMSHLPSIQVVGSRSLTTIPSEMQSSQQHLFLLQTEGIDILDLGVATIPADVSRVELPLDPVVPRPDLPDFVTAEPPSRMRPNSFAVSDDRMFISSSRAVTVERVSHPLGIPEFTSIPVIVAVSLDDPEEPLLLGMIDRPYDIVSIAGSAHGLLLAQKDGLHVLNAHDVGGLDHR